MPRLAGRAEAERTMSSCESAYVAAQSHTAVVGGADGEPMMVRYMAARELPFDWLDVAAQCTERFGEGAYRSAQAKTITTRLAAKLRQEAPEVQPARLDGVSTLKVEPQALLDMAVAEDRAGFAVEVLAARDVADADLATSDNHKTTAQQLVSLSGIEPNSDDDPRQKVYAVDALLGESGTVEDSVSGMTLPAVAVIEMDCARAEANAYAGTDVDSAAMLANLVARHAYQAFQLGYPVTDDTIFE